MGNTTEEQEAAWKRLATEVGGELITKRKGKVLPRYHYAVVAKSGRFPITLDLEETAGGAGEMGNIPGGPMTRIRAPYVRRDSFSFSIQRGIGRHLDTWSYRGAAKLAGRRKVELGDPDFDRDTLITASDRSKLLALLASPSIRHLIQSQPSIDMSVGRPLRRLFQIGGARRRWVLQFEEDGIITDVERLKSLFKLFGEILNQLCQIGSASEEELKPEGA